MPKRNHLESVLIIGSGPIVIGQACEFDYSGAQACKALREEGLRVILLNSNPATIMTDPEMADATYIEPLTVGVLEKVIERERPSALLPTLGGQTALNLALAGARAGIFERYGVELIGASVDAIEKAEDRERFKQAMNAIGERCCRSTHVSSLAEAQACIGEVGFPAILRPSFTMGGAGGAIAYNAEEFDHLVRRGLEQSPVHQILVEESVLGWKEYELEVMRDCADNVVIVCSIENFDPMGVHTGDSITVAPALTLTDREYQRMRDAACAIIREIGVDTGGSNIQFAVDPATGEQIVIEMNPRVSRSSALASKATGFPIAKIAAKLAIGYTLDEIPNDITRVTPASFEPSIDYVVTKIPRFAFDKFPAAQPILGTQMKAVGEVMSMGRTFRESLGKAIRSLETGRDGFDLPLPDEPDEILRLMSTPSPDRIFQVAHAMRTGLPSEKIQRVTQIDPWFLAQVEAIVQLEGRVAAQGGLDELSDALLRQAKENGLSDRRIAALCGSDEHEVRARRKRSGIEPVYKRVDTCAAEFEARTPYLYSTYEEECEAEPTDARKVLILGGGPNRIGQGIEFDYCCVHAALALSEEGYESIMVNCNPETVSTDYDTSDRLYFEPLTLEDVLAIYQREAPEGVIVQFGGQTPLRLAKGLAAAGVRLLGTDADAIDRAEDRERFGDLLERLELQAPRWGVARSLDEARAVAEDIGYPIMVRPSYVLGGQAMECIYEQRELERYFGQVTLGTIGLPLLIDEFLSDAIELDIDVVADAEGNVVVGGVMEHIEEAGIHSGDSACALPPYSLPDDIVAEVERQARALATELGVVGLMNAQFAVHRGAVYVIEVNPRASRTVPFVSKATGLPLAKIAARVMLGRTLPELGVRQVIPAHTSVKESVFPFGRFDNVDTLLGPEMRSTGEVMGIDQGFARAYGKAQIAAGNLLPESGTVFLSLRDEDKAAGAGIARGLAAIGFKLAATHGTARYLIGMGLEVEGINKVLEGRPHCVDALKNGAYCMVVNTTDGAQAAMDSHALRRAALTCNVSYFTTIRAARAAVEAIAIEREEGMRVRSLQSYHPSVSPSEMPAD
ncbi:carbamoyl-phosphate synthase large subunit [Haliangium ochraceum]|uniref:Carbamoyl phosphate synthase large chain n=1 Tax=Haliangium ochraceum (strain DSM 14365 / JCM 11303 / SMP-2) TaxID=502025 RepID=D0LKY4_HALO1|nr:carbamoyl-phosphate synthase large subunit [Haliangium ochraceum]ACY16704.1 carbamoyl-phosphate synthase, large subunit [Haliangium ochraceum DSM 14365]